jgi:hypothetical protein
MPRRHAPIAPATGAVGKPWEAEMKSVFAAVSAALFAGSFCAGTAEAATVSGAYTGEIYQTSDPTFPYLSLGDTYRIAFSYDTTVPDGDPDSATGRYENAVSGSVVFSNGYNLSFSGGSIYVGNDVEPGDSDFLNFGAFATITSNFPTGLYTVGGISWTLIDLSRSLLDSDALPSAYLSAALFDSGNFQIGFPGIGRPGAGFNGTLSSAPIPAALPLFAAALGGLGLVGWRRRRSAINSPR